MLKTAPSKLHARAANGYLWAHLALGAGICCWMAVNWACPDGLRLFAYLSAAIVASALKVRLPGVTGTVSVSFLFVLIGIVDLNPADAILFGTVSMLTQCIWRTQRTPRPIQVAFSVSSIAVAAYVSAMAYAQMRTIAAEPIALGVLSVAYFFSNAFSISGIIALTERKPLREVSRGQFWLLPYYAAGSSIAWLIGTMPRAIQWELPIICLPVIYVVHRSYQKHLAQIEQEKKHVEDMNGLHMRTIEALALAIDAKDHVTHDHLQRVQLYALEIGKELGLSAAELDALRAASLLHDIGKLAVPEHIISKPGKLTPAEFQKMKIHPVVGAEILERVQFPYPVAPIVRAHHEKWDGSGYPHGLRGEEIPIGARILCAVDCFDALASDRQYRRALPIEEAMARVASESGTSFDPAVVEVLRRRYRDLERRVQQEKTEDRPVLSTDIQIVRGAAPDAGFEAGAAPTDVTAIENLGRALAGQPARTEMLEFPRLAGLALKEALAVLAVRMRSAVPYDAIAFYLRAGDILRPEYIAGEYCQPLAGLSIPIGQGLTGWVAESRRPILNGNPSVEPGFQAPKNGPGLRSAIAVPVEGFDACAGVIALYRTEPDAFGADHLAVVSTVARPLGNLFTKSEPACTASAA